MYDSILFTWFCLLLVACYCILPISLVDHCPHNKQQHICDKIKWKFYFSNHKSGCSKAAQDLFTLYVFQCLFGALSEQIAVSCHRQSQRLMRWTCIILVGLLVALCICFEFSKNLENVKTRSKWLNHPSPENQILLHREHFKYCKI